MVFSDGPDDHGQFITAGKKGLSAGIETLRERKQGSDTAAAADHDNIFSFRFEVKTLAERAEDIQSSTFSILRQLSGPFTYDMVEDLNCAILPVDLIY